MPVKYMLYIYKCAIWYKLLKPRGRFIFVENMVKVIHVTSVSTLKLSFIFNLNLTCWQWDHQLVINQLVWRSTINNTCGSMLLSGRMSNQISLSLWSDNINHFKDTFRDPMWVWVGVGVCGWCQLKIKNITILYCIKQFKQAFSTKGKFN